MSKQHHRCITKAEIHDVSKGRLALIQKEFSNGFTFLKKYPKSVTFFGGTRISPETPEYQAAYTLSYRIAKELGYAIFTGGGPGIMEAANKGAFEAGGVSVGLTIELPNVQLSNPFLTEQIDFYYFFSRKVCLSFSAEAYIFFPGGFGTLDEFFEIITLIQTGKIERVPVILYGSTYWQDLVTFIQREMLTRGVVEQKDLELYCITDNADEIIDTIRRTPVKGEVRFNPPEDKTFDLF